MNAPAQVDMSDLCTILAHVVTDTRLADVGAPARRALTATLIDTVGVAFAATREPFARDVHAMARDLSGEVQGHGGCTVIGSPMRLPMAAAAMVNGTLGHGWDFDDVHLPSLAHFSTIVIPAVLAMAEQYRATGEDILTAVLVGDEVGGRLGWSVCSEQWGGTAIRNRGFFPTAILGTIAAAAAAARIAKLDVARTRQAIAIAASHAAGLAAISRGDNSTKKTQAGWAAHAGIGAALLARHGFTGPRSVLETRQGFFEAFAGGHYRAEALTRGLADKWIVEEMSFKAYPLEYIIHPLAELARQARAALGARVSQVTRIQASAAARFVTLFEPLASKAAPADPYEALISAPYCIARTLVDPHSDELTLAAFGERYLLDRRIQALAHAVEFVQDAGFDQVFPLHIAGRLRLFGAEGLMWEGEVPDVYGSPDRPMDDAAIEAKFHDCTSHLSAARRDDLLASLRNIDRQEDAGWVAGLGGQESP